MLKMTSSKTMRKIQNLKKVKIQDYMDKIGITFGTLSLSPWADLATWLHVGSPQKNIKNGFTTNFEQKFNIAKI
jgi:hypothetical protein